MADKWKKRDVQLPNIELNVYRGEGVQRGEEIPSEELAVEPEVMGLDLSGPTPRQVAMIKALRKGRKVTAE